MPQARDPTTLIRVKYGVVLDQLQDLTTVRFVPIIGTKDRIQQAKIEEYVAGRPIYELCTVAEWMEGSSRFLRWLHQDHGPNKMERKVERNREQCLL